MEYVRPDSLKWKKQAALFFSSLILIAVAAVNSVSMFRSKVPDIYKTAALISQLLITVILIYSIISAAIICGRKSRPGYSAISEINMKLAVFMIVFFIALNVTFAIYGAVSGFLYPSGFRIFYYVIVSPMLLSIPGSFIYSDQEYLYFGVRKFKVPVKEKAEADIYLRKLGGYIISLSNGDSRIKFCANEPLKDRFIESIGKYSIKITIYNRNHI